MMAAVLDALSWSCLAGGGIFMVIGGIGLLRLPDFYTRLHAAGMTDTLGAGLILVGLALQSGLTLVTVKLLLTFGFLIFTSPTAAHALAKAAKHGKLQPRLGRKEQAPSNP